MKKINKPLESIELLLPTLICKMLSICTSEERRDLLLGLSNVSNRGSIGAIFNALYKAGEPVDNRVAASRITAAFSIPAGILVNKLLSMR